MRTSSIVDGDAVEQLLLLAGALRSGLIDALAGGEARSVAEVAAAAGADRRATGIVLDALATTGVVERVTEGGVSYRLTPVGKAHLVDEGPRMERSRLLHQVNKVRGWLELPEVIRTGEPASKGKGPRDIATRSLAMGERDPDLLEEVVERCLAYGGTVRTMIDVGGAVGHLARRFSRRGIKATLLDQEAVIPLAREYLGADADAIDFITADYTRSLPAGPFDLVYFGNVYHIYSPETNARVTREAFSTVSPGGVIAIQDYILGRSAQAAMFAVNMLRSTVDGGVWTEEQHREWLRDAGFVEIEVVDLDSASTQLVLARRPRGL
mgnify:FL=1